MEYKKKTQRERERDGRHDEPNRTPWPRGHIHQTNRGSSAIEYARLGTLRYIYICRVNL